MWTHSSILTILLFMDTSTAAESVDLNLVEKFRIAARNAISAGEWW
jgi:hypothetical protein